MTRIGFLLIIYAFITACQSSDRHKQDSESFSQDRNLQIIIQHAQSYKIDLMKGIYTVLFINKAPLNIEFDLNLIEKAKIIDKFYALKLDEQMPDIVNSATMSFDDNCFIMPKIYTYLNVKGDSLAMQFKIDESCSDFIQPNADKARKVKAFLDLVNEILNRKPELRNAPKSDIFYL